VALARLRHFALELLQWNRGVSNLVSHDDETRLVERHIAESIAGCKLINDKGCKVLVDFGSGGGFPALPLALAGVGERWTLVESRRNKTLFLRRAVQELAIAGVDVRTGRLEALVEEDAGGLACYGFTSRATMKLAPTLELAARIVRPGGHAFLWKGSGVDDELRAAGAEWREAWHDVARVPIAGGPNSIAVFERKA
jgi:16S rRNA (guanine527-N7)-methyltransferase